MSGQWWALIDEAGEIRGQVLNDGRAPAETGDNPEGWREVKISRAGDLARERLNPETKRWSRDPAREAAHAARERAIRTVGQMTIDELVALIDARIAGKA